MSLFPTNLKRDGLISVRLWNYFVNVNQDRSGSISATELGKAFPVVYFSLALILRPERALVNGDWTRTFLENMTKIY